MTKIEFTVNGEKCSVNECLPRETTLNAYLRYVLGLPGTKSMCQEGGCGSCIVMVRAKRYPKGEEETFSVNSCLVLVFSCHGWEITTVEGVGNRVDGYSQAQKRLADFNGTQCGYCSPGWIMQLTSLLDKNLTMAELEKSFGSNTCRCTGFRPIYDTIQSFGIDAPELRQKLKDIEDLNTCCSKEKRQICERRRTSSACSNWSLVEDAASPISLNFGKTKFFKVYEQSQIFDILAKYGENSYMFVDGNTGKGIVENFEYPEVIIDISEVKSLKTCDYDQNMILGANVSLQDCITIFTEAASTKVEFAYLAEFIQHLELVAHIPVRKIGSIAGNLMYKRAVPTYQSDLFILLECIGARIVVRDANDVQTTLTLMEFLNYDMLGKLMVKVELPPLSCSHLFKSYKIMPRNQNALAIVNAAFLIQFGNKNVIQSARLVYGNLDPKFVHAKLTEEFLVGKNIFTDENLQGAIKVLSGELNPVDIPGEPSIQSRKTLALGLFYKFILYISPTGTARSKYASGGELLTRPVSTGKQTYQSNKALYPVNEPVNKLEALIQASGEAHYANDLPPMPREVFGAFVMSTVHNGEVDTIDVDEVLAIDGVIALYTAKDIPGKNSFAYPGLQLQSEHEEVLATKILFYGQPIAIVIARTERLAADVAKKVKVTYKNVSNATPVLTIDEAKKDSKRYVANDAVIEPKSKGSNITKVVKGVVDMEAQYHYYLEPITCVVVPVDKSLEVYDSTQWMELTQICIAKALNMSESEVVIKVRRIGGGFGGKVSRNAQAAVACALVAKKLDVPCRFILPLQTNLTIAGRRLPCQCEYEVGVDDDGKIQYLDATIIEDNGCSNNEPLLEFTAASFPNCYDSDTWSLKTATVNTDTPSNTWARAPGTCEAITSIEHIMQHIAFAVQKDPTTVREINLKTDHQDILEMIKTLKADANYEQRAREVEQFNKANRWMKKAISLNVMCFPVFYYGNYSALVSVYRADGTVTITSGGIEMGQGLNTKAAQVCAKELGIPLEDVKILTNYSFVAANNVFSGSSITTESVCYSVMKACAVIKERLAPIREKNPDSTWKELVWKAGEEQIDLTYLYMMADTDPDLKDYSAYAVSIIETQLDVPTGRFQIVRADVLEDCGISLNPKLDIGQVEGAYIQGLGYCTCEKLAYDKKTGKLETNRSLKYHVPLGLDIPVVFNVTLRANAKNPNGFLGSKTAGEMGICSAHGVTHALRQCIMESRKDSGYDPNEWIYIRSWGPSARLLLKDWSTARVTRLDPILHKESVLPSEQKIYSMLGGIAIQRGNAASILAWERDNDGEDFSLPYDTEAILKALAVKEEEFVLAK